MYQVLLCNLKINVLDSSEINKFALYVPAKEVCYERIGCFSDKPPWSGIPGRQLLGLPNSPASMNITFSLFTRKTGNMSQVRPIFVICLSVIGESCISLFSFHVCFFHLIW